MQAHKSLVELRQRKGTRVRIKQLLHNHSERLINISSYRNDYLDTDVYSLGSDPYEKIQGLTPWWNRSFRKHNVQNLKSEEEQTNASVKLPQLAKSRAMSSLDILNSYQPGDDYLTVDGGSH